MVLSVEHCWIREPEVPTLHQRFWNISICVRSVNNSSVLKRCMVLQTKRWTSRPTIRIVDGKFTLEAEVNKVDHKELLKPKMHRNSSAVFSFEGVTSNDNDEKAIFLVHLILGTNEYAKIKTRKRPRVGARENQWQNIRSSAGQSCHPVRSWISATCS